MVTSFELSDNTNDQSGEQESEYEQGEDELVYHKSDGSELYAHEYPEEGQYEGHAAELAEDHIEYVEEPEEEQLYSDEVLDIEINEPLDEFTVSLPPLCGHREHGCRGRGFQTDLKSVSLPWDRGKLDLIITVRQSLYLSYDKLCVDSLFGRR